jgi:hypothetical protein
MGPTADGVTPAAATLRVDREQSALGLVTGIGLRLQFGHDGDR